MAQGGKRSVRGAMSVDVGLDDAKLVNIKNGGFRVLL